MGKSLRENFEHLLAELPAFRQNLDKAVQAAIKEKPALKESLGELLKGFDESMAEAKVAMPATLAGLEKEMAGLQPGIDELRQSIAEAEKTMAAGAVVAAPTAFAALPTGHGQMLRKELLQRFAPPQAAATVVPHAGDAHDMTSGDWHGVSAPEAPKSKPPKPQTGIQPPKGKPSADDVGDMNSQDWR